MPLDFYSMEDEIIETVARMILYKDRQALGNTQPTTDDWLDVYKDKVNTSGATVKHHPAELRYNSFNAEVQSTVSKIMMSIQRNYSKF